MRKLVILVLVSMLLPAVQAQPATFVDSVLSIPQAALIDGSNSVYYSNVQLTDNGDGTLAVVAGQQQNLVNVDSVDVMVMESFPVQVSLVIAGNKSVPCVELLPAAVARQETHFSVVLAETVLGPAQSCIAIIDPFSVVVELDVLGLAAGTYTVDVNGRAAQFTLDVDNLPAN